jgi:hypothetical protein
MKTVWLKDCKTDAEKAERKEMIRSAAPTLKVLKNILENMMAEQEAQAMKKDSYEKASWAYLQADHLGAMRTLKTINDLLTIEETQ